MSFKNENSVLSENHDNPSPDSHSKNEDISKIEEIFAIYLLKVREHQGIKCKEGIDSLIACLLSHASNAQLLEQFCLKKEQNYVLNKLIK